LYSVIAHVAYVHIAGVLTDAEAIRSSELTVSFPWGTGGSQELPIDGELVNAFHGVGGDEDVIVMIDGHPLRTEELPILNPFTANSTYLLIVFVIYYKLVGHHISYYYIPFSCDGYSVRTIESE
jgi:hypothetical protein